MNNLDTLIFLNGKLLPSDEYCFLYPSVCRVRFKHPLNSSTQSTISNVTVIKKGIKVYESKIEEQNITEINLFEEK